MSQLLSRHSKAVHSSVQLLQAVDVLLLEPLQAAAPSRALVGLVRPPLPVFLTDMHSLERKAGGKRVQVDEMLLALCG